MISDRGSDVFGLSARSLPTLSANAAGQHEAEREAERAADEAQAGQGQIDRAEILAEIRALRAEVAGLKTVRVAPGGQS